jgi:hypothetical protein
VKEFNDDSIKVLMIENFLILQPIFFSTTLIKWKLSLMYNYCCGINFIISSFFFFIIAVVNGNTFYSVVK